MSTTNEEPSIVENAFIGVVILLFAFFQFSNLGIWSMILAPGIAQAAYQNWKWPIVVSTELKITLRDVFNTFNRVINLRNKTNYIN